MSLSPITDSTQRLPPELLGSIIAMSGNIRAASLCSRSWKAAVDAGAFQFLLRIFRQGSLSQFIPCQNNLSHKDIVQKTLANACKHLRNSFGVPQIAPCIFLEKPYISHIAPYEKAASLHAAYRELQRGVIDVIIYPPVDLLASSSARPPTGFFEKADAILARVTELSQSPITSLDLAIQIVVIRYGLLPPEQTAHFFGGWIF